MQIEPNKSHAFDNWSHQTPNKYINSRNSSYTIAPNGSEFSHRVWISFFLFYFLALSFRNFTGSHHIVPMYICTIFLRNTKSRSSWKRKARMISQWFWCKYFAHIFILYSKCSKKIYRLPILYLNTAGYSLQVPSVVFLCLGGKKTIPHCVSGGAWNILTFTSCMPECTKFNFYYPQMWNHY